MSSIIKPEIVAARCPNVQCPYCKKEFTFCFDCGQSIEGGQLCEKCANKRIENERIASERCALNRLHRQSDFD